MGTLATASTDPFLSNYAQGIASDVRNEDALFLAPEVPVGAGLGHYKQFDDSQAFRTYNTRRGLGGKRRRIEFDATDPTYNCDSDGLEVPIDDHERERAGEWASRLEQSKVRTLVVNAALSRFDRIVTQAKTVSAVGGVGSWSGGSNQPVDEIDAQIEALATACGMMPNKIAFGLGAWRIFKNHPNVRSRLPDTEFENLSPERASSLFLNPAMRARVINVPKDTSKKGGTAAKTQIVGNDIFIFLSSDMVSEFDPSFMKIFTTRAGGVESVRRYRDESCNSDIFCVDWSEDIKITGSACVKRITVS